MHRWCEHGGGSGLQPFFFSSFILHCLADHLLLQLTRKWSWWPRWLTPGEPESGKSSERRRERDRDSTPRSPLWGGTFCTLWRDATFMQHERVIFFMGVIQELLARPWHGARGVDKWCRHRPRCSATDQTRAVCLSSRRPGTVQRAWSGVGTDHSTNHWSRANCATLRLGLGGGGGERNSEKLVFIVSTSVQYES